MNFTIESNRIFVVDGAGKLIAEITFPETEPGVVDINRTFVDDSMRGQGVASQLMKAAYDEIKRQSKKAVPTCSYTVKWFETHREYADILN